jgi:ABC-type glycerol-3-phosphate transport system permease component
MRGSRWVPAVVLGLLVVASAFPFYWAVVSSFTPEARLFQSPSLIPRQTTLEHYRILFTERNFWVPIRNSLIVAGATTLFCVLIGGLCAYALARLDFRGKGALLGIVLAVGMFPQISVVSPLYLMLRQLRLINTYPGLSPSRCRSPSGCWSGSSASFRRSWKRRRGWTARVVSGPSGRSSCRWHCPDSRPPRF